MALPTGTGVSGNTSMVLPLAATSMVAGMVWSQRVFFVKLPGAMVQSLTFLGSIVLSKFFGKLRANLRMAVLRSFGLRMK